MFTSTIQWLMYSVKTLKNILLRMVQYTDFLYVQDSGQNLQQKQYTQLCFLDEPSCWFFIIFEKIILNLDVEQWLTLMCENNYNAIINNLQTRCKLRYSVNVKQSSIILHSNENYITLSHIDLYRLKQLQHCIDLYIIEKQKKFPSHQKTFDTVYSLIMADVNGLPSSCRQNEFTNQYIQNTEFQNFRKQKNK
ncbi:Uncharacterized protein FWK35_00011808 [Aphis craccivora]|uniref:Uncharacterized protein n=1 Tax=Aphis craccivora TaxID=307492 RepID=A0A6G0Z420_APHCR|nr:Uncharacterized protein FWK35_00011808 [Aphis craccivora]